MIHENDNVDLEHLLQQDASGRLRSLADSLRFSCEASLPRAQEKA